MNEKQFALFLEDNRRSTAEAIKTTVNGKIDGLKLDMQAHNALHEEDMKRILPVVEAFEASQRALNDAKRSGQAVLWASTFIVAVGSAFLMIRKLFF